MVTGLREENSELNPFKLHLKIKLVSHPACAEGLGIYTYI